MLLDDTLEKLREMRMKGMLQGLQEQENNDNYKMLSFEERLEMLVEKEWNMRENQRLTRRLEQAKLREQACVENIDYQHPRGLQRGAMLRLSSCEWLKKHQNLVIIGPTGAGKTFISCALAQKACREGYSALYRRVSRFFQELSMARADGSLPKLLRKLAKLDLLILDDWGLSGLTAQERADMLEVLEDRYGNRSTLVASQIPVKEWHTLIGDPTMADAILDRVIHNAHRLELTGDSMRKKNTDLTDSENSSTE